MFQISATTRPCLFLLKASIDREHSLAVQVLVDIKDVGSALKSMVGHNKEAIIGAELFQDQPKGRIQQAEILGRMCIEGNNFFPQWMLQTIGANKANITKIPGLVIEQVRD